MAGRRGNLVFSYNDLIAARLRRPQWRTNLTFYIWKKGNSVKGRDSLFSIFIILCPLSFLFVLAAIKLNIGNPLILLFGPLLYVLLAVFVFCSLVFAMIIKPEDLSQYSCWVIALIILVIYSCYLVFPR